MRRHPQLLGSCIGLVAAALLGSGGIDAQHCTVAHEQKISDLAGGFGGLLDNYDLFGTSVASVGDLDGNGVPDIVVGSPGDDDGGTNCGAVWVLFLDSAGSIVSEQKISAIAGGLGSVLSSQAQFGVSVCSLGDINHDGAPEIAVGAWYDNDEEFEQGSVWILSLNADGTVAQKQKISEAIGNFDGLLERGDHFGTGVASLGDLNGDGITELAVGARGDDDGGPERGAVWILFMNPDGTVADTQKISQTSGSFAGVLRNYDAFSSVGALGDLNGDGVADLAVGAPADDDGGTDQGAIWVLFLNVDGTVAFEQKISAVSGGFGGVLGSGDLFGNTVASLGDLNGDGIMDLGVSALRDDDGGQDQGAAWLLFMNRDGTVVSQRKISATEGCFDGDLDVGDNFGVSLARLGDVNGDGTGDLAINAYLDDDGGGDRGAVWIVFMECFTQTPPLASFVASPVAGKYPLTVQFHDLSSGAMTDWIWDFGNGYFSTVQNPYFTYWDPGVYSVTLTVTGPCGTSSYTESDLVRVLPRIPWSQLIENAVEDGGEVQQ